MQREKKKVKRFSKFMNNKMDYILFITVLILLSLGVVMVLSASAPSALSSTGKSYTYFLKQFEFALVGIGLMLFFSKSLVSILRIIPPQRFAGSNRFPFSSKSLSKL